MEYTKLGRTDLRVSVAGLGCGGGSKLGLETGESEEHSIRLVRSAIDLGVNFIDTASSYGTEVAVGKAIKDIPRDQVVLSTKFHPAWAGVVNNAETIVKGLENSLRQLGVEYVDVFHLHGVYPRWYDYVMSDIVPVLTKEKEKGKFRHLGVTENAPQDHRHEMFQRAFDDNCFDVIMLAYHIMNQNAERFVFPRSQNQGIGTLIMFAVRSIFSTPGRLKAEVNELVGQGRVPDWIMNNDNPLDFLLHEKGASSVIDACYRFVRHQPGADVILFGTGNLDHLMENIASINKPPLPIDDLLKVRELFGHLEGVGLDYPGGSGPKTKLGDVNEEIDTSGLKCPIPVLKAKKALRSMDAGETLRVISTDPSSAVDFIDYCDNTGYELLESSKESSSFIYVIRKT